MGLDNIPPELVCEIAQYLKLEDCYQLKLTCHQLNEKVSNIDDFLQFQYLNKLKLKIEIYTTILQMHVIDNNNALTPSQAGFLKKAVKYNKKLKKIIDELDKGRRWIHLNNPNWYDNYLLYWYFQNGYLSEFNQLVKHPQSNLSEINWDKIDEYANSNLLFTDAKVLNRLKEYFKTNT